MTPRRVHDESLRPDRLEISRLLWAIGISIVFHLLCYGGYELGQRFNVWDSVRLPAWVHRVMALTSPEEEQKKLEEQQAREVPLMFVDVNPQLAMPEPPKNPMFYSDKNSEASNPEIDQDTGVPKITGEQTEVVKADDVDRSKFDKLQPAVPQPEKEQQPEQARPRTPQPVGDLAIAKPEAETRKDTGTADQAKPRTVQEALARQSRNQLTGEKMKQDGGVRRLRIDPGFDAKASPLGNYDLAMIEAISQRWFDLLDTIKYSYDRNGKVVISFRLNHDGTVRDIKIVENTVEDKIDGMLGFLCQKAVAEPSPFQRWPRDMRMTLGRDYRDLTFTFFYR